jgi:hypothetical protein
MHLLLTLRNGDAQALGFTCYVLRGNEVSTSFFVIDETQSLKNKSSLDKKTDRPITRRRPA